jgi:hypothetical protein
MSARDVGTHLGPAPLAACGIRRGSTEKLFFGLFYEPYYPLEATCAYLLYCRLRQEPLWLIFLHEEEDHTPIANMRGAFALQLAQVKSSAPWLEAVDCYPPQAPKYRFGLGAVRICSCQKARKIERFQYLVEKK